MKVRIKTITKGPLTKGVKIANITNIRKKYLEEVGKVGIKFIKDEIDKRKWKAAGAAGRVKKSIFSYVPPSAKYVSYGSTKPYIQYQEFGVKRQPMRWLVGLNKALGPMLFNGQKTFRWAPTKRNVWIHPGLKPKRFFESGIDRTKKFMSSDKSKKNFFSKALKGK